MIDTEGRWRRVLRRQTLTMEAVTRRQICDRRWEEGPSSYHHMCPAFRQVSGIHSLHTSLSEALLFNLSNEPYTSSSIILAPGLPRTPFSKTLILSLYPSLLTNLLVSQFSMPVDQILRVSVSHSPRATNTLGYAFRELRGAYHYAVSQWRFYRGHGGYSPVK